jgi:hypothetical protein
MLTALAVSLLLARSGVSQDDLVLVGRVTRIIDGDTIDVQLDSGPVRVRMQGIDAPERNQPLSDEAMGLLRQLVDDREVELQVASQPSDDRMVSRVYVDGSDANAEMVRRGCSVSSRCLRCARMRSMSAASSMLAITSSFPPQRRHVSISIANTRLSRCAHVMRARFSSIDRRQHALLSALPDRIG